MKRLMIVLIALVFVLGISIAVFAQYPAQGPDGTKAKATMTFEERKAKFLSIIDERIKILQNAKVCVTAAKTQDDMKKCRQQIKEEQKELRQDLKQGKMK